MFPDSAIIEQSNYTSESDCVERCKKFPNCRAAVLSPASWAHRECFIVSTSEDTLDTWRVGWLTAFRGGDETCVGDSNSVFTLVDQTDEIDGEHSGLLLYRGGTVCDENFDDIAADAICKTMNYTSAIRWTSGDIYGSTLREIYDITLKVLNCDIPEWENCTFVKPRLCFHYSDVFLSCRKEEEKEVEREFFFQKAF